MMNLLSVTFLEIITKNNKISQINQIYDGTNPLMREATIVKNMK